jgi:hypothetical protein
MSRHSSPHIGNISSRTAKILSVTLILSLVLGLVLMRTSMAQSLPSIKVDPEYYAAKIGDRFDVPIRVYGATYPNSEVYSWQVRMEWTASALEMWPGNATGLAWGPFMSAARVGYWGVLLYNAPSGQNVVNVTDGSKFIIGQNVLVKDDAHSETNSIFNIQGTMITLNNNLANTYQVSANAGCYPIPTVDWQATINNAAGNALFGQTSSGVNPGAQGDGLLVTLSFYVEQNVPVVLNITNVYTKIVNTLGVALGDDAGELDKQNGYKNWNEDINANGIVSVSDLYWVGKDFNKCPIQTRHATVTTAPGTAWTGASNAYTPNNVAASTNVNGRQQDYKTWGFATTGWASVTTVQVGLFARIASGGDDTVRIDISNDGGTSWSATTRTVAPTTTTFALYWVDFTAAYAWTPTGVGNIAVRITYVTVGGTSSTIYVDWIPVKVTPSPVSTGLYSDVNKDGIVNGADLTQLAGKFGQTYGT